jgi:abortive infection bacteriophage resistance protein
MHTWGVFYFDSMTRSVFNKKPSTYEQQVQLLIQRGLNIDDNQRIVRYLNQISYYRLSAYFLPFQKVKNCFNEGVSFEDILETYKFDRKLRLLVFDNIERVEIAIRAQITNILAFNYNDAHWQDNPAVFKKPYNKKAGVSVNPFDEFQTIITKNTKSKKPEVFLDHYLKKYQYPQNPPSWMCMELLTIGELSRLFNGLGSPKDKQQIADYFGLHYKVFISWLHTLTYVRNICAHHARLWNREFAIKPDVLQKPREKWIDKVFENNHRTFYFLCTLKYLLIAANPNNNFTIKLNELIVKHPKVPIRYLGFPTNSMGGLIDWANEPLWKC